MQFRASALLVLVALLGLQSDGFRLRSNAKPSNKAAEVSKLVTHFEGVQKGLDKILQGPNMQKMKPSLTAFTNELGEILKECKTDKSLSDDQKLEKLHNAQKGVEDLMTQLAAQQMQLKKEGDEEKESLLMGVLMTHQKAPMKEQLEILADDDFKNLDVAKALLEKHDENTPLFQQVAAYLDQESKKTAPTKDAAARLGAQPMLAAKADTEEEKKAQAVQQLSKVEKLLQANLDRMEKSLKVEEGLHKKHIASLDKMLKMRLANATFAKDKTKVDHLKRVVAAQKKKEDRTYKRHHALAEQDAKSVKASIAAIKKGDVSAVGTAIKALKDSLQARQAEMGNFLHFLQMSSISLRQKVSADVFLQMEDCPYCAAQCLEKCHGAGKSYVECMTVECKDAGKR